MGAIPTKDELEKKFNSHEYGVLQRMFQGLAARADDIESIDKITFMSYFDFPGMFGERLFRLFDVDGDGVIRFDEFLYCTNRYLNAGTDEKINLLFKMYDLTGDDLVSFRELQTMMYSLINTPAILPGAFGKLLEAPRRRSAMFRAGGLEGQKRGGAVDTDGLATASKDAEDRRKLVDQIVQDAFHQASLDPASGKMTPKEFGEFIRKTPQVLDHIDASFAKHVWNRPGLPDYVAPPNTAGSSPELTRRSRLLSMADRAGGRPSLTAVQPEHDGSCSHCDWRPKFCPACGGQVSKTDQFRCSSKACRAGGDAAAVGIFRNGALPEFCIMCGESTRPKVNLLEVRHKRRQSIARVQHDVMGLLYRRPKAFLPFKSAFYMMRESFLYRFPEEGDLRPDSIIFLGGVFIEIPDTDPYASEGYFGFELIQPAAAAAKSSQDMEAVKRYKMPIVLYTKSRESRRNWVASLRRMAKTQPIEDRYRIGKVIGSGRFAKVRLCQSLKSKNEYAVKIIDKTKIDDADKEGLRAEIAILKMIDHPSIVKLRGVFENSRDIFIVMNLVRGGNLLEQLIEVGSFEEEYVRLVIFRLLCAISYLHQRGIVHRDIKPENILLPETGYARIEVADFGLSRFATPAEVMEIACGTLAYIAPEVLMCRGYTAAVDVWGAGITMFMLVTGAHPFHGETKNEIINAIISSPLSLLEPAWIGLSKNAIDLQRRLLTKNPTKRIGVEEALSHPWFAGLDKDSPDAGVRTPMSKTPKFGPTVGGGASPRGSPRFSPDAGRPFEFSSLGTMHEEASTPVLDADDAVNVAVREISVAGLAAFSRDPVGSPAAASP